MVVDLVWIILVAAAIPSGVAFGYLLRRSIGYKQAGSVEKKAKETLDAAKQKQKELLYQAKEKALQILEDGKQEEAKRRQELLGIQKRLEKRESLFDQKLLEFEDRRQKLYDKAQRIEAIKKEIERIKEEQLEKIEIIAQLSREEAKKVLLENVEQEVKGDIVQRVKKLETVGSEEWEKEAKKLVSMAIERVAAAHTTETTTTTVSLPSDEMKGRIIGREGRNIKTIEQLTGTEIVVDDTPEVIVISGFSLLRRHLAKRALEKLILDGRIQPTRIEETIEQVKKELALDIKKSGEEAVYAVGIAGLDPKLIQLIGRLKYRTSYGQNVLQHSIEVAHLSALLASELGADVATAKKAGFLHDLGKAVDHEVQGTHPEIGKDLAEKFGLPEAVVIPIATHHEDMPPTLEAVIVKVADAISGARPGARKDTYEQYLQRLEELEDVAKSFEGVEKVYAIQAGREIRVFVSPQEIDDLKAVKLAKEIAGKIEQELKYPGEIKVTVIRENRIEEYAR
ncbi:ribonuclease Y [Patescibacteria group bacterium]|nr:ribonuclease Y [Patescibacteria group bacterium]MBU4512316.1 ribonuclease Y [Patescibacteria group bacterium]MCG2693319.1 ribonuclease Y [Candidatus Parcubacteria bacterium]